MFGWPTRKAPPAFPLHILLSTYAVIRHGASESACDSICRDDPDCPKVMRNFRICDLEMRLMTGKLPRYMAHQMMDSMPGDALFDDCCMVKTQGEKMLDGCKQEMDRLTNSSSASTRHRRKVSPATVQGVTKWPLPIYWGFDPGASFSASNRAAIRQAISTWQTLTCVTFQEDQSFTRARMINFTNLFSGCWSFVGRVNRNHQEINLSPGCFGRPTIEHELEHALGILHEQSRPDRDAYVTIHFENIRNGTEANFQKVLNADTFEFPYDYESIMHYGKRAFSKNNQDTITTLDPAFQNVIGTVQDVSPGDADVVRRVYCADVDECLPGGTNDCSPNATCANTAGSYQCTCKDGFTGNGQTCTDVDECRPGGTNDCSPNAMCTNTPGSYECPCIGGFAGQDCTDMDECFSEGTNDCNPNATCANTPGSYQCTCKDGFTGNGQNCTDVDECLPDGTNDCSPNATCINNQGSYQCSCMGGFTGNGQACTDVDECRPGGTNDCSPNAMCTNTPGSYQCTCKDGFTGNGQTCTDVDECLPGGTNDCSPNSTCANTPGSYQCTCMGGFTGNGQTCTDIDECLPVGTNDCSPNAICANTPASYQCSCMGGFTGNGQACTDVNECLIEGANDCNPNATCANTPGSYQCTCMDGFTGNGQNCTDIDECATGVDNCHAEATCSDTGGSFQCQCNNGYTGSGTLCTAVCSPPCGTNAQCVAPTQCACVPGFEGDPQTECTDIDECFTGVDDCGVTFICINTVGNFTCQCKDGFEADGPSCADINECTTGNHNCSGPLAVCSNTEGGFTCQCNEGSVGDGVNCTECICRDVSFDTCVCLPGYRGARCAEREAIEFPSFWNEFVVPMGWAVYFNRRFPRGTSIFFRWRQSLYRWFPTFQDCVDYCLSTPGCKALQFQLYKRTFVRRRSGRPRFYRVKQNARTYSFGICRLSTSSNVCGSSANFRDIQPQVTNFLYRLEVEYAVLQTDSCFLTDLSAGNGQANSPGPADLCRLSPDIII